MIDREELLKNLIIHGEQGYALYYREGGEVLEEYRGFERLGTDRRIGPDSNFRMASITKQFIGRGIMALIGDGKLDYGTPLSEVFGGLPAYLGKVTIIELLNHQAHLHEYEDMERPEGVQILDPEVLTWLAAEPGVYDEPAGSYRYSNSGYVVLGLVIEKLSGQKIEDFMKERVLTPLGMEHSMINREGVTEIPHRVYGTAVGEDGHLFQKDQSKTTATIGDGGLYANVNDLNHYLDRIEQQDLAAIYTPMTPIEENYWYSKGIRIAERNGHRVYCHSGGTTGTHNFLAVVPDLGIRAIFLSNIDGLDASLMLPNILKRI
ncbi:MAG: beta-lactamase family protein [Eubacterium sp.]|nr:beta-lactamase family protein [Eubacterium sp.]